MRFRAAAAALALATTAAPTPAAGAERELRYDLWPDAAITAGVGVLLGGELLLRRELAPDACRFCGGNAFDRGITEALAWENHEAASTLSDAFAFVVLPAGSLAAGLARDGWEDGAIDFVVVAESIAINVLLTEAVKLAVARQRPLEIYLDPEHEKIVRHPEELNVSFPSGHASTSFAIVAATATVAGLRGEEQAPIWIAGVPLATAVSYFRVAGYHHWTTDVLAGAALGTAVGVLAPRLLHSERREPSNPGALAAPLTYSFVF